MKQILQKHFTHDIEIVKYATGKKIYDTCIECLTCQEVIYSSETEEENKTEITTQDIAKSIWRSGAIKDKNKIRQQAKEKARRLMANDISAYIKDEKDTLSNHKKSKEFHERRSVGTCVGCGEKVEIFKPNGVPYSRCEDCISKQRQNSKTYKQNLINKK